MSVLVETRRPCLVKARCTCKAVIGVSSRKVGPNGVVVRCPRCETRVRVRQPKVKARRKVAKPPIAVPVAEFQAKARNVVGCAAWFNLLSVLTLSFAVVGFFGFMIHELVALVIFVMAAVTGLGAAGVGCASIYQAWDFANQADERIEMTPGKAAFLLLIPLFNIYWSFRAIGGLGRQYRDLAKRHGARTTDNSALAISIPILGVAANVPFVGPVLMLISGFCMMALLSNLGKSAKAIANQAT